MRFLLAAALLLTAVAVPVAAHNSVANNAALTAAVPQSFDQIKLSFAPLVKQTAPAVVNIYTKTVVKQNFNVHPFFRQFFGDMIPPEGITQERVQNSLGSGVIVAPSGIIVTADHVIKDATAITVVLNDRREYAATVQTRDPRTDLAVLRINPKGNLPFLPLADSDALQVGDLVAAIGNPFGVGQTVTTGIVSALARTGVGISDYSFFIQTDAAINPGNSGGALVTMDGKLAGINSAIFSKTGGSLGIGFAIPATMVQRIVDAGTAGDARVVRPWLGITGQPVTAEIASSLALDRPAGVLVSNVHASSPLKDAGVRVGDVIIAFNGKQVDDVEALRFRAASEKVGGNATLSIIRTGEPQILTASLIAAPEVPKRETTILQGNHLLRGVTAVNLSPAVAEELEDADLLNATARGGVVLMNVPDGSPGAAYGFDRGDRVLSINDVEIKNVADLQRVLGGFKGRGQIVIERAGRPIRLVVR